MFRCDMHIALHFVESRRARCMLFVLGRRGTIVPVYRITAKTAYDVGLFLAAIYPPPGVYMHFNKI